MDLHGYAWICMGFNGVSMGFHELSCVSIGFHGFLWVSIGFYWFLLVSIGFNGFPGFSLVCIWGGLKLLARVYIDLTVVK